MRMENLMQSIITTLLSWIRTFMVFIWDMLSGKNAVILQQDIYLNWKTIVVYCVIAGLIVDCIVWFLKWRPFYLWKSKLYKLFHRTHNAMDNTKKNSYDNQCHLIQNTSKRDDMYAHLPDVRQYNKKNKPPALRNIKKKAESLKEKLNTADEEDIGVYSPPKPSVNKANAFNTPVYPSEWAYKHKGHQKNESQQK